MSMDRLYGINHLPENKEEVKNILRTNYNQFPKIDAKNNDVLFFNYWNNLIDGNIVESEIDYLSSLIDYSISIFKISVKMGVLTMRPRIDSLYCLKSGRSISMEIREDYSLNIQYLKNVEWTVNDVQYETLKITELEYLDFSSKAIVSVEINCPSGQIMVSDAFCDEEGVLADILDKEINPVHDSLNNEMGKVSYCQKYAKNDVVFVSCVNSFPEVVQRGDNLVFFHGEAIKGSTSISQDVWGVSIMDADTALNLLEKMDWIQMKLLEFLTKLKNPLKLSIT